MSSRMHAMHPETPSPSSPTRVEGGEAGALGVAGRQVHLCLLPIVQHPQLASLEGQSGAAGRGRPVRQSLEGASTPAEWQQAERNHMCPQRAW